MSQKITVSAKKITPLVFSILALVFINVNVFADSVYIVHDKTLPQAKYASDKLVSVLKEQDYTVVDSARDYDYLISIAVNDYSLKKEAFSIIPEGPILSVYGGDERGMLYGVLALVEDLKNGIALDDIKAKSEEPHLQLRAIKHNFPWDSYRPSKALDQHYDTTRDLEYWEAFLDMMVENRFNALTLWNLHPWIYMVKPHNFPEASPFSDREMKEWRELHRGIFRMAKERGIDTYLVPWNIFVSKEFVEAHDVGHVNTYPYYNTKADGSELIKRYVRESVAQVLEEYPNLTGLGLSHSEGMGGWMPEQRDAWLKETYLAAIKSVDRPVKLIHKVPSSAGKSMDGSTSVDTEQLVRTTLESIDYVDGPIWLAGKYNWSHGHSTPTFVRVHGGELHDTYFKPEPENYKFTWIVRNEDFHALRWGVPSFIREHIQLNGSKSAVGGYIIGSETYIPALDYFTAVKKGVDWDFAFERQWLFYKLWGRLLYNPETSDTVFTEEFARRYGAEGKNLLNAYELASKTPLRLASLFNATWDHTLYSEGMLALGDRTMDYISVDRLIQRPVLDPAYVSIADYVDTVIKGNTFSDDRVTPLDLAKQLESDCRAALQLVEGIDTSHNVALMYEVADVQAWSHLGLHLAEKIRGGVALQMYRQNGGEEKKLQAIDHLENALAQWDEVIGVTRPIYKDMRLTHLIGSSKNLNPDGYFHWELIRPHVAEDVEVAKQASVTD
ncbi:hypothetical protein [Pseudomaricurvus sp.]|uniref:hypothetical protein n=1 Tax=Pseudomaricurvus sp. TaxID=2004510 RepID=UPI003F6D8ECB